ncbi:MAG: sulfatase-like hydrolase/transferase [Opitutales bacterium]|nr:sulfatase-like hydrolase/transferase [Opitutales bacterium]
MSPPPPPNLLFILTDEQRFDTLFSEDVSLPNINRLASGSCFFEEAYCTQPVCTPSRGSLMTGLYPHAHGAVSNNTPLPPDRRCLPELLPAEMRARYRAAYHGKWHLGDEIFAQHGFDEWIGLEDQYAPHYRKHRDQNALSPYTRWLLEQGFQPDEGAHFSRDRACCLPEAFGKPAFTAQEACRFLNQAGRDPFILFVNFLEPHMPFFGPRSGQYDPATLRLPENFGPQAEDGLPLRLRTERFRREGFEWYNLQTEAGWRQMTAGYRGLCSLVDEMVGRILSTLEATGQADNTIIVFTSDHGEMMGSHGVLGKSVMNQEAVRVPLVVRLPGQRKMQRISGPFSQIDLMPTLLELMGTPPGEALHGQSRAPLLGGNDTRLVEDIVVSWNEHPEDIEALARASVKEEQLAVAGSRERYLAAMTEPVRTLITADGWRFSTSPELGEPQLFHLREDPFERHNLANDPAQASLMSELTRCLGTWQKRTGDTAPLSS